jgi:hypothetical protein
MVFTIWSALLIWPTVVGLFIRFKGAGDRMARFHNAARWFFWVSLVSSPIFLPFLFA